MNVVISMYVCHSQANKGNKNFFSLFTASKEQHAAERKEKIYSDYM